MDKKKPGGYNRCRGVAASRGWLSRWRLPAINTFFVDMLNFFVLGFSRCVECVMAGGGVFIFL